MTKVKGIIMRKKSGGHFRVLKYCCMILMTALLFSASSCSAQGEKAVMRVGGNKITYDEYRYFYMNYRDPHVKAGESDYTDDLKQETEEGLRQKYAKFNLIKEHKIALDDSDKTDVKNQKASYIESYGGMDSFKLALEEEALTETLFDDLLAFQILEEKLRTYMTAEYTGEIVSDDETVEAFIYDHFIHATHVLILNEPGDDLSANLQLAKEIQGRAVSGEDFNSLIDEFNEDPGMEGDNTGYYFTKGQIIAEFENAAEALDEGEISDVVLSENGYHIIKRMPLDQKYIDENFEKLRDAYKARMFNIIIEQQAEQLKIEYTDLYQELDDMTISENTFIKKVK